MEFRDFNTSRTLLRNRGARELGSEEPRYDAQRSALALAGLAGAADRQQG